MKEPGLRWDGRQWLSVDGLWAWNGSQWLQSGSDLPIAARSAIYAAIGLAVNLPIMFVLALFWGLQGPGWDANPPDLIASLIQIALTLGGALLAFCASWFLLRIDRRDWWLGAVLGWPWFATAAVMAAGSLVWQPRDVSALVISACVLLFAAFPLAGSIVGRRRLFRANGSRPQSAQPIPTLLRHAAKATWLFVRAFGSALLDAESRR